MVSLGPQVVKPLSADVGRWIVPPVGSFKLNCDVAVRIDRDCIGIGVVIRSNSRLVVVTASKVLLGSFSPEIGEFLALREGLLLAILQKVPLSMTLKLFVRLLAFFLVKLLLELRTVWHIR
ncbi:hypothetical protein JRO89_XS03G0215300 [Xanthoceras sorbifolium]|uniref:RNase H type-1 domain-containing protein n=1 Tax=Xanthoceras sorbifolium TaxID=99658 RepID=A0ABQ8IB67_9ROSI|nr:hypothetical protein JRO89_XS03G0215300 [Xanthoceras sorbifolium]